MSGERRRAVRSLPAICSAGFLLAVAAQVGGAEERKCSAEDREALIVGALEAEVRETVKGTGVSCVMVGVVKGETRAPSNQVMIRLRRIARVRVEPVNRGDKKCPEAPQVYAWEPEVCSEDRAYVYTGRFEGSRIFRKVSGRWEDITAYE